MKHALILGFSLLCVSTAIAETPLPTDSLKLLEKLEEFTQETLEEANALIAEKERQVAEVLQTHLERETKAGNLDQAIALKARIDQLLAKSVEPEVEEAMVTSWDPGDTKGIPRFVGLTWASIDGDDSYHFKADGTGIKTWQGNDHNFSWRVRDDDIVEVFGNVGDTRYFRFQGNRKAYHTIRDLDGFQTYYEPEE